MTVKNKIHLSIAIFLLLTILMVVFVIYPLLRNIKNSSNELIFQKNNLLTLETQITNLEKFKTISKGLEEILKKVDSLFVDPKVPIEFISFLEKNSKNNSLDIEISQISAKKMEKDAWSFLILQASITGSFPNFLRFFEKLEASPYLIEIQNLSVSTLAGQKPSSSDNIKADFLIKVFAKE